MRVNAFCPILTFLRLLLNNRSLGPKTILMDLSKSILMDLSKAFDCLNHELLISKLEAYGFSKSALKLVYDYLSNRKQRVKINGSFSSWQESIKGVPQGSVLGPLSGNFLYLSPKCNSNLPVNVFCVRRRGIKINLYGNILLFIILLSCLLRTSLLLISACREYVVALALHHNQSQSLQLSFV